MQHPGTNALKFAGTTEIITPPKAREPRALPAPTGANLPDARPPRLIDRIRQAMRLRHLATERSVAASTQNQALSALLFLYRNVLGADLPWMHNIVRAKRNRRLPVVLSRAEVARVLQHLPGTSHLMALLLYGSGLRLLECAHLRVKDIDFDRRTLLVRAGKGDRDRRTLLPSSAVEPLRERTETKKQDNNAATTFTKACSNAP